MLLGAVLKFVGKRLKAPEDATQIGPNSADPGIYLIRFSATKCTLEKKNDMNDLAVYFGLFLTAFAAATILPMQSETALSGLILLGEYPVGTLVAVVSVGNVAGSVINWMLGRGLDKFHDKKWFPVKGDKLDRAAGWYHKYGRWSLLLSWAPLIGDPITVVAGVLREPFWSFLALVAVAKTGRYLVLTAAVLELSAS